MLATSEQLVTLSTVSKEWEAAMIEAALADHGIQSQAVGGFSADFRAEAPGVVRVLVRSGDLERARQVLQELGVAEFASEAAVREAGVESSHSASTWRSIVRMLVLLGLFTYAIGLISSLVRLILG